jgi:hypothetical protein
LSFSLAISSHRTEAAITWKTKWRDVITLNPDDLFSHK